MRWSHTNSAAISGWSEANAGGAINWRMRAPAS
jgi:hypothetical protein